MNSYKYNKKKFDYSEMALNFIITDFCNLDCEYCIQGVSFIKEKKIMSLEDIRYYSKLIKEDEFNLIKLSGGEPTLHPQFGKVCEALKTLFPGRQYYIATNGKMLKKHLNMIDNIDYVQLSNYPGVNDEEYNEILKNKDRFPNIIFIKKQKDSELENVFVANNLNLKKAYKYCLRHFPPYIKTIHNRRIYQCCVIFGNAMRQKINHKEISVEFDKNWRENLLKLDINRFCKTCFVNVNRFRRSQLLLKEIKRFYKDIKTSLGQSKERKLGIYSFLANSFLIFRRFYNFIFYIVYVNPKHWKNRNLMID